MTQIERAMLTGSLDALKPAAARSPAILLGKDLAATLHVSVGDSRPAADARRHADAVRA